MVVGAIELLAALEDEALERRLLAAGFGAQVACRRARQHGAAASGPRSTRARRRPSPLDRWLPAPHVPTLRTSRSYPRLVECKRESVSVIPPRQGVRADDRPPILDHAPDAARCTGLVDEVLVVDAASVTSPGWLTGAGARRRCRAGGRAPLPEHGPARGKGDAMWRGLAATTGDIVVYIDADSSDVDARRSRRGAIGPLLCPRRPRAREGRLPPPFSPRTAASRSPNGGGRVTELMARPLLNLRVPELAGFAQPLALQIAARRWLLERLSFPVGYGVEIAMLIDALREVGPRRDGSGRSRRAAATATRRCRELPGPWRTRARRRGATARRRRRPRAVPASDRRNGPTSRRSPSTSGRRSQLAGAAEIRAHSVAEAGRARESPARCDARSGWPAGGAGPWAP